MLPPPETPLEAERGRQKYMTSPILLPSTLPSGPQTKENHGKRAWEMQIVGSVPCGTKQSRGKTGRGSEQRSNRLA